jgi:GT2 family glycosyltransferase
LAQREGASPALQIQTVLHKTPPGAVDRFMSSVVQAAVLAKKNGSIGSVCLVVGDCSPLRVLSDAGLPALRQTLLEAGIDDFEYEFFNGNIGSAAGHNRLLPKFGTDLVLILNPDIVASPFLIDELLLRLNDASIGLVEGRQLPIEHPKYYDPSSGETSWATTACALIPRRVIEMVGDFDSESFFLYCDDVDYSWRIRLAGYKVIFHPPARVFHDKRLDSRGHMEIGVAEEYYAAEAALMMTHKWSRPDLVESYLTALEGGTDLQRKAVAGFRQRQQEGRLPEPLDPDHRVGEFHDVGHWARHRW